MFAHTTLVLGLASAALATYSPQHLQNLRDLHVERDVVEVRQATPSPTASGTGGSGIGCQLSAVSLLGSVPTPTGALQSYLQSAATVSGSAAVTNPTALCQVTASLPQSLSADYSSYDSAASSWYSQHVSDLSALASSCSNDLPVDPKTISAILSYATASNPCSGVATASPTSGDGASDAASSSTSSISVGGAARPTGIVAGAVAAAGFLGAAAML
ncbi:hypothetical protein F4779DRAFT_258110 [Xylariaceae sp. FL0662B]|nr:hypothetical protein F4779DRAFT_258110 [Xylariaceae sp. FL0662B]